MNQDLIQCLMNLRKSDMQDNAIHFGENLPSSWNKDKMADKLAQIYMQNSDAFLSILSLHVLLFMLEIFEEKKNGQVPAYARDEETRLLLDELCGQLELWGLIDYSAGKLKIASFMENVVNKLEDMQDQVVELQEIEECAQGILMTYGLLEEQHFLRILKVCFPDWSMDDMKAFLMRRANMMALSMRVPTKDGFWWFHSSIDSISDWYWAMQDRKDMPYCMYTKDDFLNTAMNGLVKEPKNFVPLLKMLRDKGLSEFEAEDFLVSIALEHCCSLKIYGVPQDITELEWKSQEELQSFIDLFVEFQNDTPLWINKGFTPKELAQKPFSSNTQSTASNKSNVIAFPQKTGRNELCPCGSGKKYKNCCGKDKQDE